MNNILLIDTDNISAYYTVEALSKYKGLKVMTVNNLADAFELVTQVPFLFVIYHALIEENATESFVEKTLSHTLANNTRYYVYFGSEDPEKFKKFNYETLNRTVVVPSKLNLDDLIKRIAEIVKNNQSKEKKYNIDVKFVNPFIQSSISTLELMCFVQNLTHLAPKMYNPKDSKNDPALKLEIIGTLEMESPNFTGRLSLCFPKQTFLKITSNMLGAEYTEINSDIEDSAAELTNIIYGQTKRVLSEQGYSFNKSFPKVVTGHDKIHSNFQSNLTIYIPFVCDEGKFFVFITVYG